MRTRLVMLLTVILALAMPGAGIALAQDVPRPPQVDPTTTPASDEEDDSSSSGSSDSCAALPDYYRELNRALMSADALNAFLDDGAKYEDLTERDATAIVDDLEALIKTVEGLEIPAVYADGNAGIAMLLGFIRDQIAFYGLDSTKVPKFAIVDEAYQLLYDGETMAADACPKEIKEFGGYIFIDPATIEDDVDTGN